MFENKNAPVASQPVFIARIVISILISLLVIAVSLGVGELGVPRVCRTDMD